MNRFLLAILVLLCSFCHASTLEVLGEGSATIENGDVAGARELATRRAVAHAVESKGAMVSGQITVVPGVALESAQMRATGCATQMLPLGEVIRGNELTVSVKVSVASGDVCSPTCQRSTINRIAVTGFAMEFPDYSPLEGGAITTLTAVELARFINARKHLLAVFDSTYFPYTSPSRAPEQQGNKADRSLATALLAKELSSQYVLSGIYRDLGVSWNTRRIEIEAFLHDGANGSVVARRSFVRTGSNGSVFGRAEPIGSPAFFANNPGRTFGEIFSDIAIWVDSSAGCLPFMTRVLKVQEHNQLQIDAGAESGVSIGDTMSLHQWKEPPVRRDEQSVLGREKYVRATVRIRAVYPNFSVGELLEAPKGLKVVSGDLLYAE